LDNQHFPLYFIAICTDLEKTQSQPGSIYLNPKADLLADSEDYFYLKDAIKDRDKIITQLTTSLSWKLTQPLRMVWDYFIKNKRQSE
jgi:hypothetical protein